MRTLTARPALRWLVPLVALVAVLGSFLVVSKADAQDSLPPISAEDLLVKVGDARVDGLSGTIVQSADLGIPAIPGGSGSAGGQLTSLLSGSHTMHVWYASPDKARVAVSDEYAETDTIADGNDVWTYDSRAKTATHTTLSAADRADRTGRQAPAGAPQTPQDAAKQVLAKVSPTTAVSIVRTDVVAHRDVYELVLTPKDPASLVKRVQIAVDGGPEGKAGVGATYVPLRVQVYSAADKPAVDVGFTDVTFAVPDKTRFEFKPAEGTKVEQKAAPEHQAPSKAQRKELEQRKAQADKDTTTIGEGWTSVVVTKLPAGATSGNDTLKGFLGQLKPVSGSWGTGRELDGTVVTAILTDDGRLAVGAVGPEAVSQALAR